jgi:hypothetical protein
VAIVAGLVRECRVARRLQTGIAGPGHLPAGLPDLPAGERTTHGRATTQENSPWISWRPSPPGRSDRHRPAPQPSACHRPLLSLRLAPPCTARPETLYAASAGTGGSGTRQVRNVGQNVWLRLVDQIGNLREPGRFLITGRYTDPVLSGASLPKHYSGLSAARPPSGAGGH